MDEKLTIKKLRKKFRLDTGKDATIKTITESSYRSGLPKKKLVEQYHPEYTYWLENLLLKLGS